MVKRKDRMRLQMVGMGGIRVLPEGGLNQGAVLGMKSNLS